MTATDPKPTGKTSLLGTLLIYGLPFIAATLILLFGIIHWGLKAAYRDICSGAMEWI